MRNKKPNCAGKDWSQEHRLLRRNGHTPEAPPEAVPHAPEAPREPERPAVRREQESTRHQARQALGHGHEHPEATGAARQEIPPLANISTDPHVAEQQLANAHEELLAKQRFEQVRHELIVDRQPLAKNVFKVGAVAGSAAFIPSYLAYLGSAGPVLTSMGTGVGGALLGNWWKGDKYPVKAPLIGGAVGVAAAPLLGQGLRGLGTLLEHATPAVAAGTLAWTVGLGMGFWVYHLAHKKWERHPDTWYGKPRGKITSAIVGVSAGAISAMGAGAIGHLFSGYLTPVLGPIGNGFVTAGTALPAFSVSIPGIIGAGSLCLTTGAAAAGIYGLGRLEGRLWGRKRTGIAGNLLRGIVSPITIPAWAVHQVGWKLPKHVFGKIGETVRGNVEGTKRIFTGKSPVTSPVRWLIRTGWRGARGLWRGLSTGYADSPPSELDLKHGVAGKFGRAITKPIGKILSLPKRLWKYFLSRPDSKSGVH